MSEVYKAIELVGTSEESFDSAVRNAVKRAGETIRDLRWLEVLEQRAFIKSGDVHEYQSKVRIWFNLEDE